MTSSGPGRRRGYSLIELFAVMTVMAVLLALCAGLIKLMLRLDQSSRDALTVAADSARLAHAFRADAHRATEAPPPPEGDRIAWTLPAAERVEYLVRGADILREVRRPGRTPARETFRRPPHVTARFESGREAGRPILAIVIRREPTPRLPAVAVRVDAEFARLVRLTRRQP